MSSFANHRPLPPVALSTAGHGVVAAIILTLMWVKPAPRPVNVSFDVIEQPVPALSAQPPRAIQAKPEPKKAPRERAVFGQSKKAIRSDDGVAVKEGNTVAKAPDNEKLRAGDADELPIPTEEYLVSRMPEIIAQVEAPYPEAARKAKISGPVVFDLLVDDQGRVRDVKLIQGLGYGLDEAAAEAVRKLRFKPAYVQDKPVAVRIRYAHRFILEK